MRFWKLSSGPHIAGRPDQAHRLARHEAGAPGVLVVTLAEDFFRVGERKSAGLREFQSPPLAQEKVITQVFFQFADLAGQRGLGDME